MKGLVVAALAFFAVAAPARADFTVTPSTTQAGAPADVTFDATFPSTPSSVTLRLPPGLVGNPNAKAKCSQAQFESLLGCGVDSLVGTATALGLAPGGVYNLQPNPGEPARLGIAILGLVKNQASISLRPDGGLDSTIADLQTGGLPLTSLQLTLNSDFMTLPTSCIPATATIVASGTQSASFTPTACANVPFRPTVQTTLETARRAVPSGATVTLGLQNGDSHVRRAEIALPVGTTLSPGVANGLQACTTFPDCPAASQIGTVRFATPLLGTLPGKVYFGDGFRLYVVVEGQGVRVALAGDVKLDPATGQITTVFDNLPQVPFTAFSLSFQGGSHAVLANPGTCGSKTVTARLTPWSGNPAKTVTGSFTITGCETAPAFAPALRVSADSAKAGRPAGATTLAVSRPDGSEDITRVTTELPPGLAGSLKGVPVCPDAAADAGACPADTRVGSVSATAGSGDAPVALGGTVSLTGPTDGGLAGLAIALPGKVGPVDLGTVVVRASLALRPDGGVNVRTRPLPRLIGGVPVSIRQLALTLDRPGFILNSSSCAPQQVHAILEGADGSSATVTAPYQATDCAGLRFSPRLEATVGARGRTGKGRAAPLRAVITVPPGQSSTASAAVTLPKAFGTDVKLLRIACRPAAGACPATSHIGSAIATTPLLPVSLTSPVTLAMPPGGGIPGLSLTLSGPVTLPLLGSIGFARGGQIQNTFAGIPDVPLERFELTFNTRAPLRLMRDVCHGPRQTVRGEFTGHNGALAKVSARLKVAGCPPVVSLKRRGHKVTVRVTRGRDAPKIRRVTLNGRRARTIRTTAKRFRIVVRDASGQSWVFKKALRTSKSSHTRSAGSAVSGRG